MKEQLKCINTLSVCECDTEEKERIHNYENCQVLNELWERNSYCMVEVKRIDLPEIIKEEQIFEGHSRDIEEVILSCDIKNGVNIYVNDSKTEYVFFVYGQSYTYKGDYGLVTTVVKIKFQNA